MNMQNMTKLTAWQIEALAQSLRFAMNQRRVELGSANVLLDLLCATDCVMVAPAAAKVARRPKSKITVEQAMAALDARRAPRPSANRKG
jgi:hypothetical protein